MYFGFSFSRDRHRYYRAFGLNVPIRYTWPLKRSHNQLYNVTGQNVVERNDNNLKTDRQYSPVRLKQARLVSSGTENSEV